MLKKPPSILFRILDRSLLFMVSLSAVVFGFGFYVDYTSTIERPSPLAGSLGRMAESRSEAIEKLIAQVDEPGLDLHVVYDYDSYRRALSARSPYLSAFTFEGKVLLGLVQERHNLTGGPITGPEAFVSPGLFTTTCHISIDPRRTIILSDDPSQGQFHLPFVFFHELGHCLSPYGYWSRTFGLEPEREEAFADVYSVIRQSQLGISFDLERLIRDRSHPEFASDVHTSSGLEGLRGYKITKAPAVKQAEAIINEIYPRRVSAN